MPRAARGYIVWKRESLDGEILSVTILLGFVTLAFEVMGVTVLLLGFDVREGAMVTTGVGFQSLAVIACEIFWFNEEQKVVFIKSKDGCEERYR